MVFKSDKPEYLPWDIINIPTNGFSNGNKTNQGKLFHNVIPFFTHDVSDIYSTGRKSIVESCSPKPVSLPKIFVDNTAQIDDDLSRLKAVKSLYTDSDASVDGSVPSLVSSSERPLSPSPSVDCLSQCDQEEKLTHKKKLLPEEKSSLDELLYCEETLAPFIDERWTLRHKELLEFVKINGHANVPHTYPENQALASWVKRQRRQYKLLQDGKPSAMTLERIEILDSCGFIWDFHELIWREKIRDLQVYFVKHGHCNVKSNYKENKKLGTWVKCQRRQYKLYRNGKPSSMDANRVKELERMGFEWEIRRR